MKIFSIFFILSIIFIPRIVFGGVIINEIMYDIEGSDTGLEWIEVLNNGSEPVDLSVWKLYENETNHSLNLFNGSDSFIKASGYAVISDNAEKFLANWPEFSGTVFDSSFSLKNDGEILIIRNDIGEDIDSVDYLPEWGASGDGNSLQLKSDKWETGSPTPGASNGATSAAESGTTSQSLASVAVSAFLSAPQIYAFSGDDTVGVTGSILEFNGVALGLKKEPLLNARFLWNFGDGSSKEGKNVAHTYNYPGDYIVFLDVSSGEYGASSRTNVKIIKNELKISDVKIMSDGYSLIELYNESESEIDVSYWMLKSENAFFSFPKNSIIMAGGKLSLPSSLTKLSVTLNSHIYLIYPNGSIAYSWNADSKSVINNSLKTDMVSSLIQDKDAISDNSGGEEAAEESLHGDAYDYAEDNQQANVLSFSANDGDGMSNKWIFFAIGLVIISVFGVVLSRHFNKIN